MSGHSTEWDAKAYHRVSEPQFAWGLQVLDRLELTGSETVVDAGCGSGRLTQKLLERLPRGRVIAVDRSQNMLAEARALLGADPRVQFLSADLTTLSLPTPVDVIFSTATFHWVPDHDTLFKALFAALSPGGQLVAQCGGEGNLDQVRDRAREQMRLPRFASAFDGWSDAWHYATVEQTRRRLERSGFTGIRVWREEAPTAFEGEASYRRFLESVVARLHLARLPQAAEREAFLRPILDAAANDSPPWTLDYRRLNFDARRPSTQTVRSARSSPGG